MRYAVCGTWYAVRVWTIMSKFGENNVNVH